MCPVFRLRHGGERLSSGHPALVMREPVLDQPLSGAASTFSLLFLVAVDNHCLDSYFFFFFLNMKGFTNLHVSLVQGPH